MNTVWFGFVQILVILSDISVSKLLGFETFPFFWWFRIRYRNVLVSKKYQYRYRKNLVSEKDSDSVSKRFGIGRRFGFVFVQILCILCILGDISVSKLFHFLEGYGVVIKKIGIKKSIGLGINKIWYR